MVFLQFSGATAFYHLHNGWALPEAFYHAVDAGLSIGSGAIAETDQMSMVSRGGIEGPGTVRPEYGTFSNVAVAESSYTMPASHGP